MTLAIHGGTDDGPPIAHDFSSNANPLGPPPALWQAVLGADRRRYPDPAYTALRQRLAAAHDVEPERILPTSGGAEAIRRLTLVARQAGLNRVFVPQPGFGDYAAAAAALNLAISPYVGLQDLKPQGPALVWICEPRNPSGGSAGSAALQQLAGRLPAGSLLAVDTAYAPLRLEGEATRIPERCWQLHCPNKALGLTGIRAAYLVAPSAAEAAGAAALAASWVIASEGEAMLRHWHDAATQDWLSDSRLQLRDWAATQRSALAALGWHQQASCTPFWLAKPPAPVSGALLRERGIKLRDASSFGLPGWFRIATLPPASQDALMEALAR
ncbi:aminotransferase class I/II-fold pyridoxal phosphate-dependent enzyme [Pelomonas sp. KK5]|uniref:aminotransferase class I/II-fold pyridoxal phosphate-dependent enzyme n=1 Tax=Pelomonas sp. KK5 TaxID=1855730 RepID=UPI00097BAAF3|nr:aminotransferase class I/II-fold pyridoxal phosphate-dependent enzyme [Pelomonas sp. KK5]